MAELGISCPLATQSQLFPRQDTNRWKTAAPMASQMWTKDDFEIDKVANKNPIPFHRQKNGNERGAGGGAGRAEPISAHRAV